MIKLILNINLLDLSNQKKTLLLKTQNLNTTIVIRKLKHNLIYKTKFLQMFSFSPPKCILDNNYHLPILFLHRTIDHPIILISSILTKDLLQLIDLLSTLNRLQVSTHLNITPISLILTTQRDTQ